MEYLKLAGVFTSAKQLRFLHDARNDHAALKCQYDIDMRKVLDTQIAHEKLHSEINVGFEKYLDKIDPNLVHYNKNNIKKIDEKTSQLLGKKTIIKRSTKVCV
eukprot:UN00307